MSQSRPQGPRRYAWRTQSTLSCSERLVAFGRGRLFVNRPRPSTFYPIIGSLKNLQSILANLQADAAVRNLLQRFGDQTVECFGAIARQLPVEGSVDVAQVGCAIDD